MDYPYVFLDATYCKARVGHRVVSQAVVVAFGVAADGRREVLGFDVGDSENEGFWTSFLRSLKTRGLVGVKLAISDAHNGLKKAISTVFQGAGWQRCRVHFMRNVLAFTGFPARHWRQIWSTNPMERVNKKIKRRTDVVRSSPTPQPCCGSPEPSSSSNMTNGKPRTDATSCETSMAELKAMHTTPTAHVVEAILLPELTAT